MTTLPEPAPDYPPSPLPMAIDDAVDLFWVAVNDCHDLTEDEDGDEIDAAIARRNAARRHLRDAIVAYAAEREAAGYRAALADVAAEIAAMGGER